MESPRSSISGLVGKLAGGTDRERRLVVRTAELERRIELLEADAAAARALAMRLEARIAQLDAHVERLEWLAAPGMEDLFVPAGGRSGLTGSGTSSRVLCSAGTGPDIELLSVTAAGLAAYAWRWGWDVTLSGEDDGSPPVVRKLRLVRELLDRHAWVLWLDPDASIVDLSEDVLTETRPDLDLYVSAARGDEPVAGRPVMLVRASELSRRLLDHLVANPEAQVGPSRAGLLRAEWAWSPGDPLTRGPYVMLGPGPDPAARRAAALERLAALRRGMAGTPGALGGTSALTAFGPASAADVPDVLNALGLSGTAVVVGPAPDGFCEHLARAWGGSRLVHVDPAAAAELPPDHLGIERWTGSSDAAALRLGEETPDVVWLLGGGRELALTQRLMTWWPLVRPGGLMLGHPYAGAPLAEGTDAAREPVDWFFGELGIPVHATPADAPGATWMVRKPVD